MILVAFCLLSAVPVFPQSDEAPASELTDVEEGRAQGKADARGNALWFIPGLLLPGVGVILPWVFSPTVPSDRLIGKSDDFVAAYRAAYLRQKKLGNFLWALAGTGTTVVVLGTAAIVVIVEGAVGATTACGSSIENACNNCAAAEACSNSISESCSSSLSDACSNVLSPTCSSPTIGCSSFGFLPRAALTALPPP